MYRIRLVSGEEAVYRSAEELAVAVKAGVVSSTAEVFHNAANRWLPIAVHPDYKALITGKRPAIPPTETHGAEAAARTQAVPGPSGEPPAAPATPWVPVIGKPESSSAASEPDALTSPAPLFSRSRELSRTRRLRTVLALTMGLSAAALIGGGGFAAWRYVLPWLEQHRPPPGHHLAEGMPAPAPVPQARKPDSFPTTYPAPSPPLSQMPTSDSATTPPPSSETHTLRLPATRNRIPSYFEAYADARAEMDEALGYINFQHVFAPARFATPESLRATRRMVAAAGNIVRVYRGREVMMEQTYRPEDPGGKGSLRESFETAEAVRSLLSDVDSVFGLMVFQQGRFRYSGESVSFEEPRAAEAYAALRSEIASTIQTWRDLPEATDLVTIPRLLRAFDGATPPPLRH